MSTPAPAPRAPATTDERGPDAHGRHGPTPALAAQLPTLAADLRELTYTTDAVGELLGPMATNALEREQAEPARRRVAAVISEAGAPLARRGLAAVVCAWMLGDPVPAGLLDEALPRVGAQGAAGLGLGDIRQEFFHPTVDLSPYSSDALGELWLASDQTSLQTRAPLPSWHVLGTGRASLTLAGNVVRDRAETALDLGCGCGIQTLHLLAHAHHVTATDLSGRALDFTGFNLHLNAAALGLDTEKIARRVALRRGDLLEPVAGQRFDLIVSNPPFVITPRASTDPQAPTGEGSDGIHTYRDGGRTGDALLEALVRTLPEHLRPGGSAQLLGNWEIHRRADPLAASGEPADLHAGWDQRVRAWLPAGIDAWIIQRDVRDPAGYAETWLQDSSEVLDPERYAQAYRRYLQDFEDRGVAGVGFGYLWLRRPRTERSGWVRTEEITGEVEHPLGPAIAATVGRRDALGPRNAGLSGLHLVIPADVTEERYQRFGAEHPAVILARQGSGFRRTTRLDTAAAGLMAAADGELGAGQLMTAVAAVLDLDESAHRLLVAAVAELVVDGFLVPAPGAGTDGPPENDTV